MRRLLPVASVSCFVFAVLLFGSALSVSPAVPPIPATATAWIVVRWEREVVEVTSAPTPTRTAWPTPTRPPLIPSPTVTPHPWLGAGTNGGTR